MRVKTLDELTALDPRTVAALDAMLAPAEILDPVLEFGASFRVARKEHWCTAARKCYERLGTACASPEIAKGDRYVEQYGDNGDAFHPDRYHVACYARVRATAP